MTFNDVKWALPQCPSRSILQVGGESWLHKMGGYGNRAYVTGIELIVGTWDYILFPELVVDEHISKYLNPMGMVMFINGEVAGMICLFNHNGIKVYKKR